MPRKYVRKYPDRKVCTQEQIDAAKKLIEEGKSKRTAAGVIGIDESTLRKRLKLGFTSTSMGRFAPTFTHEQENEIYNHCKSCDDMFYGLTLTTLRKLVFDFANVNKIDNRFDKVSKMAGKDWVYGFIKRHPDLALRQTTPTSLARAIGFNKVQVNRFYANLKECQEKYKFSPGRIYNMDETGISTVPKKTPRVISQKGKKNVNKIVSGERGQTITVVCCVSATGNYVPPGFIFPRKRMKAELLDRAPTGSIGMTSDSGFINSDLYLEWLGHFKNYVSPTAENPVLLIIDNHSSHISLQATSFCRQHNIVVLTLPPHSSHKLQPLDRAIYSPLKNYYALEADKWMAQHPGRSINQFQVASIFDAAFKKVATISNAASAFKVTGIYPFDNNLFTEADFAPSSVTDMFCPSGVVDQDPPASSSDVMQSVMQESAVSTSAVSADYAQEINNNNNSIRAEVLPTQHEIEIESGINQENLPLITLSEPVTKDIQEEQSSSSSVLANISNNNNCHIPLNQINPLPKVTHIQTRRKNGSKSQIITDSPFKNMLEEKQKESDRKIGKPALNMNTKEKRKRKNNKKDKTSKKEKKLAPNQEFYCPLCGEKYEDPPTEEWIKCNACKSWWHENCSSYVGGIFTCDICL